MCVWTQAWQSVCSQIVIFGDDSRKQSKQAKGESKKRQAGRGRCFCTTTSYSLLYQEIYIRFFQDEGACVWPTNTRKRYIMYVCICSLRWLYIYPVAYMYDIDLTSRYFCLVPHTIQIQGTSVFYHKQINHHPSILLSLHNITIIIMLAINSWCSSSEDKYIPIPRTLYARISIHCCCIEYTYISITTNKQAAAAATSAASSAHTYYIYTKWNKWTWCRDISDYGT